MTGVKQSQLLVLRLSLEFDKNSSSQMCFRGGVQMNDCHPILLSKDPLWEGGRGLPAKMMILGREEVEDLGLR